MIKISRSVIPNFFTTLNIFNGFLSLIFSSRGEYTLAAVFIISAGLFDLLDGIMARLTNSSSKFGVELDSLADVVSFGAAPAYLAYSGYLNKFDIWGIIISSMLLIFGAFRLARFNTMLVGFKKDYFIGLPIPTSAATIAAYFILFTENEILQSPYDYFFIPLVIILSYLMVSRIKYDTLPKISPQNFKKKPYHFLFIIISMIVIVFTKGKGLFYIFVLVILFGIFRHIYLFISPNEEESIEIEEEIN